LALLVISAIVAVSARSSAVSSQILGIKREIDIEMNALKNIEGMFDELVGGDRSLIKESVSIAPKLANAILGKAKAEIAALTPEEREKLAAAAAEEKAKMTPEKQKEIAEKAKHIMRRYDVSVAAGVWDNYYNKYGNPKSVGPYLRAHMDALKNSYGAANAFTGLAKPNEDFLNTASVEFKARWDFEDWTGTTQTEMPLVSEASWLKTIRTAFGENADDFLKSTTPKTVGEGKWLDAGLRPISLYNLRRIRNWVRSFVKAYHEDNQSPQGFVMTYWPGSVDGFRSIPCNKKLAKKAADVLAPDAKVVEEKCVDGVLTPVEEVNMVHINKYLVKPMTRACKKEKWCSLAGLFGDSNGVPDVTKTYFVSHGWGASFFNFVETLENHAAAHNHVDDTKVHYWVCTFANNQQDVEVGSVNEDVKKVPFAVGIDKSAGVLAVQDDMDPEILTPSRIWCTFELFYANQLQKPLEIGCSGGEIIGRSDPAKVTLDKVVRSPVGTQPNCNCALLNRFANFDVQKHSVATVPKDKEEIEKYFNAPQAVGKNNKKYTFGEFSQYINLLPPIGRDDKTCSSNDAMEKFDVTRRVKAQASQAEFEKDPAKFIATHGPNVPKK